MTSLTVSTAISTGRVQLVNVRQRSLLVAKWRVFWVVAAFSFVALIAFCRIAWIGFSGTAPGSQSMFDAMLPPRGEIVDRMGCLLYTSPSPRDRQKSRMPSSA